MMSWRNQPKPWPQQGWGSVPSRPHQLRLPFVQLSLSNFKLSFLSPTSIFYDFFFTLSYNEDHHFGIFTPPATRDPHHTSRSTFRASIFCDHTHILFSPAAPLFSSLLFRLNFCCKG
ncbi:hypothetical protein QVD17_34581 [Tagetes erecta]|uniref:Uncharacterized protein n=1 Tax=Tagetes erecta TaxID=13708 RepID=A0AAD8JZS2_TARER|nr:hypothetical protein QVD17_34581 [Tagetes erecta]